MIRAPIPARIASRYTHIRRRNGAHIRRQRGVNIVGVNRDLAARRITRHVLVDDSEHLLAGRLVVRKHTLRAEQAAFLTGVEVELKRGAGLELGLGQDPEGFQDDDHARAVVVSAGAAGGGRAAGGVVVRRNNY